MVKKKVSDAVPTSDPFDLSRLGIVREGFWDKIYRQINEAEHGMEVRLKVVDGADLSAQYRLLRANLNNRHRKDKECGKHVDRIYASYIDRPTNEIRMAYFDKERTNEAQWKLLERNANRGNRRKRTKSKSAKPRTNLPNESTDGSISDTSPPEDL